MKLVNADSIRHKLWDEGINTEIEGERGVWVRFKKIEEIIDNSPRIYAIPIFELEEWYISYGEVLNGDYDGEFAEAWNGWLKHLIEEWKKKND